MSSLTEHQSEHLKRLVQQRREELLGEIREVLGRTGEHPYGDLAGVPDTGDEAIADLLIDVDNAMVHRDVQEIRDIDAALQRMDDGSYGVCMECGLEIGYDRLTAYPTAKRCAPCQGQHEKTHAHETMAKF